MPAVKAKIHSCGKAKRTVLVFCYNMKAAREAGFLTVVVVAFDWYRNISGDSSLLLRNIHWFHSYIRASQFTGGDAESLQDKRERVGSVFRALNLSYNEYAWAHLYDHLPEFPLARDFFLQGCEDDLIIGYELSRGQKRVLADAGKKYIDIRTHPIRFLTDYHLCAASNDAAIHARLCALAPTAEFIDCHVAFHKARAGRRYQKRMDPSKGIVFFGQTAFDSARIRHGEFLDDSFIIDRLDRYISESGAQNVYYKAHPHEPLNPGLVDWLKKTGARETTTHTYDLLSVKGVRIAALSSSVCHEAPYFGAEGTAFYRAPELYSCDGSGEIGVYQLLPANIYERAMWLFLLEARDMPVSVYPVPLVPFRQSSGLSWG